MAGHHSLPVLHPQHHQPSNQQYYGQEHDEYQEPAQYRPHQQQYDQLQPVQPPLPSQTQAQSPNRQQQQHSQQQPQRRPRTFSFQSNKSHKSQSSTGKVDLHETSEEKEARRLHTKADPTVAMSEAEPSAVQAMTKTSLAPLRSIQHKDGLGNPIAEPDRSNPTRSRWERPLDTIRSFEAAIDGGYRDRRKSYARSDAESIATSNRRSSYYATSGVRYPNDSYYGSRPTSNRPESSQFGMGSNRQSYYDNYQNGGGYYNGNDIPYRQRVPRTQTDPHMNGYGRGDQHIYPLPNKDRSYETVTSAAGSGSTGEQAGYHTDPTSSDNSSIERERERAPPSKPEPVNDYGIGFSQPQQYQPAAFKLDNGAPSNQQQAYQQISSGTVVPEKSNVLRPVAAPPQRQQTQQRPESVKGKSWFSRRFSKSS